MEVDFYVRNPITVFIGMLSRIPIKSEFRDLLKNIYSHHGRYYHSVFHLAQMVNLHYQICKIKNISFAYNEETILMSAIGYHDSILDPLSKENEQKSADLWKTHRAHSGRYGNASLETETVDRYIRLTANHFLPRTEYDALQEWFIGLDLASLASPSEMFQQNTFAIRAEYSKVSEENWKSGRGGFLEMVNKVEKIYLHPIMHDMFEEKARENIKNSKV